MFIIYLTLFIISIFSISNYYYSTCFFIHLKFVGIWKKYERFYIWYLCIFIFFIWFYCEEGIKLWMDVGKNYFSFRLIDSFNLFSTLTPLYFYFDSPRITHACMYVFSTEFLFFFFFYVMDSTTWHANIFYIGLLKFFFSVGKIVSVNYFFGDYFDSLI